MSVGIRLASAPINWGITSDNDPGNPDSSQLLQSVAEAGYVGCEIGPLGYFGNSASEIRNRFSPHGLDVVAFWVDISLADPLSDAKTDWLDTVCRRLRDLGAGILIVSDFLSPERWEIVSRVANFPERWWSSGQWAQVRLTLTAIAEVAARSGVTVAVHPHVGGHIETGEEIAQLLLAIDDTNVRLCIDTGHIRIGGVDAIPILQRELHHVVHVHAKDIDESVLRRMQSGEIGYDQAVGEGLFCDLGAGMVDWQGFRATLVDGGYNGWVVAEQDRLLAPGSQAPYESNRRNVSFLNSLFT